MSDLSDDVQYSAEHTTGEGRLRVEYVTRWLCFQTAMNSRATTFMADCSQPSSRPAGESSCVSISDRRVPGDRGRRMLRHNLRLVVGGLSECTIVTLRSIKQCCVFYACVFAVQCSLESPDALADTDPLYGRLRFKLPACRGDGLVFPN